MLAFEVSDGCLQSTVHSLYFFSGPHFLPTLRPSPESPPSGTTGFAGEDDCLCLPSAGRALLSRPPVFPGIIVADTLGSGLRGVARVASEGLQKQVTERIRAERLER